MSIRVGILGYGNLGKGVESAIAQNDDMELKAVFTRRNPENVKVRTAGVKVLQADELSHMQDELDVLFLCGGSYLLFFAYSAVGPQLPEFLRVPIDALYRFGFGGYLLQESYSWAFPYLWLDIWKPVLLEIGMILLEFFIFWRIWRRKATT